MLIEKNKVVTLNYTLKDDGGEVVDQSHDGSFVYLHGAKNIIPGLETALDGKQSGDSLSVSVEPEEGYGARDEGRTQEVPRDMFPEGTELSPGMQFHAEGPDNESMVVMITEVKESTVTVDGNHPLAGMRLNFDVQVMDVREATDEEIQHGHVHGPHGHQHD